MAAFHAKCHPLLLLLPLLLLILLPSPSSSDPARDVVDDLYEIKGIDLDAPASFCDTTGKFVDVRTLRDKTNQGIHGTTCDDRLKGRYCCNLRSVCSTSRRYFAEAFMSPCNRKNVATLKCYHSSARRSGITAVELSPLNVEKYCQLPCDIDCGLHGICVDGKCMCSHGYLQPDCKTYNEFDWFFEASDGVMVAEFMRTSVGGVETITLRPKAGTTSFHITTSTEHMHVVDKRATEDNVAALRARCITKGSGQQVDLFTFDGWDTVDTLSHVVGDKDLSVAATPFVRGRFQHHTHLVVAGEVPLRHALVEGRLFTIGGHVFILKDVSPPPPTPLSSSRFQTSTPTSTDLPLKFVTMLRPDTPKSDMKDLVLWEKDRDHPIANVLRTSGFVRGSYRQIANQTADRANRNQEWDVLWCDQECFYRQAGKTRRLFVTNGHQRVNSLAPLSLSLSSRRKYATGMSAMHERFPEAGFNNVTPLTFVLPDDVSDWEKADTSMKSQHGKSPKWVWKGGYVESVEPLPKPKLDELTEGVVQRYIKPLLLGDKAKWDLRVYVLITSIKPVLRAYIYDEGHVSFCQVSQSDKKSDNSALRYLCNKWHTQWTFDTAMDTYDKTGLSWDAMMDEAEHAIRLSLTMMFNTAMDGYPEQTRYPRSFFQLIEFKFVVDLHGHPHLFRASPFSDLSLMDEIINDSRHVDLRVKVPLSRDLFTLTQSLRLSPINKLLVDLEKTTPTDARAALRALSLSSLQVCDSDTASGAQQIEGIDAATLANVRCVSVSEVIQLQAAVQEEAHKGQFTSIFPDALSDGYLKYMTPRSAAAHRLLQLLLKESADVAEVPHASKLTVLDLAPPKVVKKGVYHPTKKERASKHKMVAKTNIANQLALVDEESAFIYWFGLLALFCGVAYGAWRFYIRRARVTRIKGV